MFNVTPSEHIGKKLPIWLVDPLPENVRQQEVQKLGTWTEIRLFISSTFVDTHGERDVLIKHAIPNLNRKLSHRFIRIIPVDLRWGVLAEETKDCKAIQKTCLNQIDKCRQSTVETPWFIGLRTQRYGWVQNEIMPSHGFETPELYSWIDKWESQGNNVSITSLECMHAAQVPKDMPCFPTVLFYERDLQNPDNIEENLRWLFDFEYVTPNTDLDPETKFQYVVSESAGTFKSDQRELNNTLQKLPYIKYSKYKCCYTKGGARYTLKRENAKSFGVAYVDDLQEFQDKVEADLLQAIEMNFQKASTDDVPNFQFENILHESSIKEKASFFVGRTQLIEIGIKHCSNKIPDNISNVMVFHGEPGCGKSGLLAAISQACLKDLLINGDFQFTHIVDSCPGSNVLEKMLQRLQLNLRQYRRNLGELGLSSDSPTSASELKKQHHKFLGESANKYPEKLFVIIIDAVNQFQESLQALTMWWLPHQSCPQNVRFLITTLNMEKSTFENACKVYPNAVKVQVGDMSDGDLQEMVTATLGKFNKKLTVTNDPRLGNQMELLLSKNKSPLYIVAACEALRQFGIYENISGHIRKLPNNVCDLFSFLLDEWTVEYGKEIVEDIAGFIYVSKDGLLENEINDLLDFKENSFKGDGLLYQSSFSRLYYSLSGFLASGGGGYLRFFHDQLKYTVKRRYMPTDDAEQKFHCWLSKFFYNVIQEQIKATPIKEPPAYYEHALQNLVYHQLLSTPGDASTPSLMDTLRNIYFVRERVRNNQKHTLNQDYMDAIPRFDKESAELREWKRFVQLYAPAILEFPEFCYNIAINQSPTSTVYNDTKMLPAAENGEGYPLTWVNNHNKENPMVATYSCDVVTRVNFSDDSTLEEFEDCVASTPDGDICCAVLRNKAVIFDQSSGEILHELDVEGYSLTLSKDHQTLWIGDFDGFISVWDIKTGTLRSKIEDCLDGCIVWLELIDDMLACATGPYRNSPLLLVYEKISCIALFSIKRKCIWKRWSTKLPGCCFCYHAKQKLIFSGHEGMIKGWDLAGNLTLTLSDANECVYSLCAHPLKDMVLSGSNDSKVRQWSITEKALSSSFSNKSGWHPGFGGNWCVQYDALGKRILCSEPESKSLRIYSLDGVLQDELTGHVSSIKKISLVPDTNWVLTADEHNKMILWNLPPEKADEAVKTVKDDEIVEWCDFTPGGDMYITLSMGAIRVWETSSHTLKYFVNTSFAGKVYPVVHPFGEYICVGNHADVYWYKLPKLPMCHSFRALKETPFEENIFDKLRNVFWPRSDFSNLLPGKEIENKEYWINDVKISPDGSKLLVLDHRGDMRNCHAIVFDISDINKPKRQVVYRGHGGFCIRACNIHSDSIQAATCGDRTMIWSLMTGETFYRFEKAGYVFVKFFSQTKRIVYDDGYGSLSIHNLNDDAGVVELRHEAVGGLRGGHKIVACLYQNESLIVSASGDDGTIRMFDTLSGKCIYGFFHSQSQQYTSLAIHPSNELLLAANKNGTLYILKAERH